METDLLISKVEKKTSRYLMQFINLSVAVIICLLLANTSAFAQRSLFADYKARAIGDVITIELQENINGATNRDYSNDSRSEAGASGTIGGNLAGFVPIFGADAKFQNNSSDRNRSSQTQYLRGTVSAVVESITPSGDLIISGSRSTEINGELHQLSIKGYVRSADIDVRNTVPSFRIANAEITYVQKKGPKQILRQPGFVKRVLLVTLSIGLGAAVVINTMAPAQ
jgi:flagellar L-ring protein precursor FlgH